MEEKFYIDDHAVLVACLTKASVETMGLRGREAAERAIRSYARERGLRMAMRCIDDGEPLTAANYFVYGEWADTREWSKSEIAAWTPNLVTHMTKCGWCDSWKKYDLLEWGGIYCDRADEDLLYGFNPALSLRMRDLMSRTGRTCVFDWVSCSFESEEEMQAAFARRAEIIPRVTKGFLYHCGHMLCSFRREYLLSFGIVDGLAIVDDALGQYAGAMNATDKVDALIDASNMDPLRI